MRNSYYTYVQRFILWYLKKYKMCFTQHGKYGWECKINFHNESHYTLEEFNITHARHMADDKRTYEQMLTQERETVAELQSRLEDAGLDSSVG